ncbi:MAG: hypothetical protein F6K30_18775, partial [Cyanothece sp. SIO2G6]|nr:hypothetical protein [Cyanothece sp. SIO2G6]
YWAKAPLGDRDGNGGVWGNALGETVWAACGVWRYPWSWAEGIGMLGLADRFRLAISRRFRRFSAEGDRGVDGWVFERRRDRLSEGLERDMLPLCLLSQLVSSANY